MTTCSFLNEQDDIDWLKSVHLKNLNPPVFNSYIIYGNEDYPDRVELFEDIDPLYTDKPCATFTIDSNGDLEAVNNTTNKPRRIKMKQTINLTNFRDAFRNHGRQTHFSYEGAEVLFEYLEEYEESTGEEFELDVVALCCDYSEDTPEDIAEMYNIDIEECEGDEEAIKEVVLDYLNENTIVVGETSAKDVTIVYMQF